MQISKICKFCKLRFSYISPWIDTFDDVWGHFANFCPILHSSEKIKFLDFKNRHYFRFSVDPASRKMSKKNLRKNNIQFYSTFSFGGINFASLDFFIFLHELAHLATLETILQISKNFKFFKLKYFYISPRIGTFRDVWGYFANSKNLQYFPSFFLRNFFNSILIKSE